MKSKNLALLTGVTCIAVLATYAWAATQEVTEVKVEEGAAKVEEAAEPARLCIPMAEAAEATEAATTEESSEAKTEETDAEASTDEAKAEEGAAEAEPALPLCDEDGNPPVADEAAGEEKTEEAAEEPAKTE